MIHFATSSFWEAYDLLPSSIKSIADKNFAILKTNPSYPSLHLKKIKNYRSVRVGNRYRALAVEVEDGLLWFWIGTHAKYDKLLES